jgi:hypothetical protein
VRLWVKGSDSTGFFIFRNELNVASLLYERVFYIWEWKDNSGRAFVDSLKTFIPVSKAFIFQSEEDSILINHGFKKAPWYPGYIFNY